MFIYKKGFFFFLILSFILAVLYLFTKNLSTNNSFLGIFNISNKLQPDIEIQSRILGLKITNSNNFKNRYWTNKLGIKNTYTHYVVEILSANEIVLDLGNTLNNLSIPTSLVSFVDFDKKTVSYAIGLPQKDEINSIVKVPIYLSGEYLSNDSIKSSYKESLVNQLIYKALLISSKGGSTNDVLFTEKEQNIFIEMGKRMFLLPFKIILPKTTLSRNLNKIMIQINKLFSFKIVKEVYAGCCNLGSYVDVYKCTQSGNVCTTSGAFCGTGNGWCVYSYTYCQDIYNGDASSCNVGQACCVGGCTCPTCSCGRSDSGSCYVGGGGLCIINTPCTCNVSGCGTCSGLDYRECAVACDGHTSADCPTKCGTPASSLEGSRSGCGCSTINCPETAACCSATNPDAPTLSTPASGTTVNINTSVNLDWNPISNWGKGCPSNSNTYQVCVSSTGACDKLNQTGIGEATTIQSWTPGATGGYIASWKVTSNNGSKTATSETRTLCIENQLCATQCGQDRFCSTDNCPIDETLTNCSSTITTQYIETPQTTGTVWARATGCGSQVTNFQFPTWNNYNNQDDLVWYNATNQGGGVWESLVNVASHQPLLGNPIIVQGYDWGCNHTTSSKKFIGGTSFTVVPKTCSVTINTPGAESTQSSGINVTVTGNAHINPGSDTVRVWISREDMGLIPGGVTYDYGGSMGTNAVNNGSNFYSIDNAYQSSVNSANTSATFTVHVPGGKYRVHCDLPNQLDGNDVRCSGNPNCDVNGGTQSCGWKSCSANDWLPFRINYMPELKPTPPAPTPTLPPPAPTPTTMPVDNFLELENSDNEPVPYDIDTKNHTCQIIFAESTNPRQIKFVVTATDEDGSGEITNLEVRLNTATTVDINGNISGNWSLATPVNCTTTAKTKTCTFRMNLNDTLNAQIYNLEARATDSWGDTSGWIDSGRDLKIWDCLVQTSGTLYKAIDAVQNCPSNGFDVPIDSVVGFNSIVFSDTPDVIMTDNDLDSYGPPNNIVWGKTYLPLINGGDALNIDGTLLATNRITRITDTGAGTADQCTNSQFKIGNESGVPGALISAYSATPQARIDFSFLRDQEAWYQVFGAGVKGKAGVESGVPITATNKTLTLSGSNTDNGLVSSNNFLANLNGCNDSTCLWGNPNNWWLEQNTNDSIIYNYNYFYNNFYVKAGIGKIKDNSWGGWATDEIYFVSESLDIKDGLTVPNGETMMVVVNGDINVDSSIDRLDGIYIANGNISVGGTSTAELNINGMLYARGNISLSRGFTDKTENNKNPAIKVNYSPGLIFKLPPEVQRVLSGWREE